VFPSNPLIRPCNNKAVISEDISNEVIDSCNETGICRSNEKKLAKLGEDLKDMFHEAVYPLHVYASTAQCIESIHICYLQREVNRERQAVGTTVRNSYPVDLDFTAFMLVFTRAMNWLLQA
jgi:hypothetical protein